jgi:hypothetical protein
MTTSVYSIHLDEHVRRMMDEMGDVNWQAEIREAVENMVREKKKATLPGRGSPVEDEDVAYREQRRRDDPRG